MPKPYSIELRERAIAYQEKHGRNAAASVFNVSKNTLSRWKRQLKQTGQLTARPWGGGRPPAASKEEIDAMVEMLKENPDLTLAALKQKSNIALHISRIHQELKRRGISLKKKRSSLPSKISRVS